MNYTYKSYTLKDLPLAMVKKYAEQYTDVDMWLLTGMNENEFPFLIWSSESEFTVMYWTSQNSIVESTIEDPVLHYAFALWLQENAHPVFKTRKEAEEYAIFHHWPRN